MTKDILETIVRMNAAASTDAMRHSLNGVHVKVTTPTDSDVSTWLIEACDGHVLAQSTMTCEKQSKAHNDHIAKQAPGTLIENGEFIVPSDAMARLKAFLKALPRFGSGLTIKTLDMGKNVIQLEAVGESVEFRAIDAEFPKTAQLIPAQDTRSFVVGLNPELLMKAFKAMKADKRNNVMRLYFDPESKMAAIRLEHGESVGVLMPMRI